MLLYILPCILGLSIKGYFLYSTRNDPKRTGIFFGLMLVLAAHNFCEVFGYLQRESTNATGCSNHQYF